MDAAIASVARDGVAQLSLRAVAREVGVSHAAPKNHFADKATLLQEIALEGFQGLGQALAAAREAERSALDGLAAGGRAYVRYSIEHPGHFRVMWRSELLAPEGAALQDMGQAVFDGLVAAVVAAQAEGWGSDQEAIDLAMLAWASVHGLAQLYLDGPLGNMDPRTVDTVVGGMVDVIVQGLTRSSRAP